MSTATARTSSPAFAPLDYALYATTVAAWSLSWFALSEQVGVVAVEVSLVYRFAMATAMMVAWVLWRGDAMRFAVRDHLIFLAMGVCLFSMNFNLFYYASQYIVSGLLSVVFSLASVINIVLAFLLTRERPAGGVVFGALLGVCGIAALFAPSLVEGAGTGVSFGLALCVVGTLFFCVGNQFSARLQARKVSVIAASAWGMAYGTLASLALALAKGEPFLFDTSVNYVASLLWLAIVSTVIAFASYLTLVGRIGPGRAGYATVIFPVFALLASTWLEGYQWTPLAVLGLVLVLSGNVFVIRGR